MFKEKKASLSMWSTMSWKGEVENEVGETDRGQVMARQLMLRGPCRNSQQTGQRGRFRGQGRVSRKERGLPTPTLTMDQEAMLGIVGGADQQRSPKTSA